FKIDFAANLDPSSPETSRLLARPWTISSPADPAFRAQWTPSREEITLAISLMTDANERIVTGPTAPHVVTTGIVFDPKELVAGHPVVAKIDVQNTGGSSARDVVVTTRSSVEPLHNLRFAFGNVAPGTHKTQSMRILIPSHVSGDSVTLVVSVDEA